MRDYRDPAFIEKMRAHHSPSSHSPEQRAALSATLTGTKLSPEHRQHISEGKRTRDGVVMDVKPVTLRVRAYRERQRQLARESQVTREHRLQNERLERSALKHLAGWRV